MEVGHSLWIPKGQFVGGKWEFKKSSGGSGSISNAKTDVVEVGSNVLGEKAFSTPLKSSRDGGVVLSQV